MDNELRVQVLVPRGAIEELDWGGDVHLGEPAAVQPDRALADGGFVEFVVIGLVGLAGAVISRLIRLHERNTESGVILDLGTDPPSISYVARVPHGTLIVREPGHPAQVHSLQGKDPVEVQQLFDVLVAAAGA
ncbi:hypothetical protein ACGFIF_14540 [Kribbella sp. NPDC049174]|uniref:hypothetical protein n=1 Tax=Kribbella sp. NPDC049174 TaxID=3364112 RepID=UPI003713294B